jgi:lysophospholipase L1-like esterase
MHAIVDRSPTTGVRLRVASVGDSLSTPNRYGPAWVERACDRAEVQYVCCTATAGQTVAEVRGQIDAALAVGPDVVVVLAGTNDFVHRRVVRPTWGLALMLLRIRRAGVTPVGATVPPHDDLPLVLVASRLLLNGGIRTAARVLRVPLVDLSAPLGGLRGWDGQLSDDRRHPNSRGVDAMAARLVPVLRTLPVPSAR